VTASSANGRTPDVTVIMPVYNAGPDLTRALDSVFAQTLQSERVHMLVVDDGSTDGSPGLLDALAATHPSLEVFHRPNSGGPAAPRNFGLQHVRGRYIFFLDQDDYLAPDALEAMVTLADENGTDVVVPRMKGVGGRKPPVMDHTVKRTDVFSSDVFWTLSPIKLFRTELIRTLGVRFGEDFRMHEDIGFVAEAYIRANGISIAADDYYVYWTNRDDRSNITLSRPNLADRLPGLSAFFDLIGRLVPAGPQRDSLMRRPFQVEAQTLCRAYRADNDPVLRPVAFARLREVVAAYYTPEIDRLIIPSARILFHFVAEDDEPRFLEYLFALAAMPVHTDEIIEDSRVFLALPWFRDPARGLPDELFEIDAKRYLMARVEPLEVRHDSVLIRATCRLGVLTDGISGVSIVAKARSGAPDIALPLTFAPASPQTDDRVVVDEWVPGDKVYGLAGGELRDLWLRVDAGNEYRERPLVEAERHRTWLRVVKRPRGTSGLAYVIIATRGGSFTVREIGHRGVARIVYKRAKRSVRRRVRKLLGRGRA
jgi:hypothetical protein